MAPSPWAVRESRERSDTARHNALLDAAARVFAEHGYEGTTVAAITREADVSRATMYVYFASKEDIFLALARRVRDDFLGAQEPRLEDDSPRAVLRATVRAHADAAHRDGPLLALVKQRAKSDPDVAALAEEILARPIRRFARYLEREHAAGRIAPVAPVQAVAETVSYALTEGILARRTSSRRIRTRYVEDVTAILERLVGLTDSPQPEREAPR
ncbi:MAG: TetR/AcrR family transcriptional regulator [Nocardioidaceae bacterium]